MKAKKEFVLPIITLSLICLFVSGALAIVNSFTAPVIQTAAEERAVAAMKQIIPDAYDFYVINKDIYGMPRTITGIFSAMSHDDGILGYIFMITVAGYGGDMNLICGIDNDGIIIRSKVLSHTETRGMTDAVFADPHQDQYIGKDKNLEGITGVTGATVSSNAYKNGIRDALTAFSIVNSEARL